MGAMSGDGFHQFVLYVQELQRAQIRAIEFLPKPLTQKASAEVWNISGMLDESWKVANQIPVTRDSNARAVVARMSGIAPHD